MISSPAKYFSIIRIMESFYGVEATQKWRLMRGHHKKWSVPSAFLLKDASGTK